MKKSYKVIAMVLAAASFSASAVSEMPAAASKDVKTFPVTLNQVEGADISALSIEKKKSDKDYEEELDSEKREPVLSLEESNEVQEEQRCLIRVFLGNSFYSTPVQYAPDNFNPALSACIRDGFGSMRVIERRYAQEYAEPLHENQERATEMRRSLRKEAESWLKSTMLKCIGENAEGCLKKLPL